MNELLNHSTRPTWPHWHNQTLRLTISEIENPTTVIDQFFQAYHLPDIRTCLNNWLQDSLAKETIESKQHVFTHQEIEKLVEATWIIRQNGIENNVKKTEGIEIDGIPSKQGTESPENELFGKPVRLIEKVSANPLFVIKEVFDELQAESINEYITKWQEVALSNDTAAYNSGEKRAVLLAFCNAVQLLIEALHSINKIKHSSITEFSFNSEPDSPMKTINNYFAQFPITYVRRELWDWLHAGISYNGHFPENLDCEIIFYTYESVLCLVEAGHQIHKKSEIYYSAVHYFAM